MPFPYQTPLNNTLVNEGGIWTCEAINMTQCVTLTHLPVPCAGTCIEANIDNQNAPRLSMTISTEITLTSFEIGKSMNFTWSYRAQFWRVSGPEELPPAQFSSLIEDISFTEEPLNHVVSWGSFIKMEHNGSLVVPPDRTIGLSISAAYPSPVMTGQGYKFTVNSISLIFDGAPIPSTSDSPSSSEGNFPPSSSTRLSSPSSTDVSPTSGGAHKYAAWQMGALGGVLGAVILVLLAIWYLIRRWEKKTGDRFELKTGFGIISRLWAEANHRRAASSQQQYPLVNTARTTAQDANNT
ncbi:hypothetical protein CPB86DRAFT_814147 [Serendipita vermifera]|nr:hypothetical protein CPB86DRAFT_814147 [Serendipita vermifera]